MQMAFGIFLHASVLLLKRDCGFPFSICLGTSEMHIATVASSIASVDVRREWQFHVRFAQWLCRCVRVLPNSYVQWKKGRPSFLDFCWQAFAGRKREEREREPFCTSLVTEWVQYRGSIVARPWSETGQLHLVMTSNNHKNMALRSVTKKSG